MVAAPELGARADYPWRPDQGDGTYRNPVILADYSDPDVIRVGDTYYLVASSFNAAPGLPILKSTDLVNWTIAAHAISHVPDARYARVQHGAGVWAPALRENRGLFYIFFPLPDEGIYVTTARHPQGPWSPPHQVIAGKGLIDPCPLWDDDGKAYLVHAYARSRSGIKHQLRVRPMSTDGRRLLGDGQVVFDHPERHPTLEGPKFLKRDGWYYILAPAGGVAHGWQVALRSRSVYGPYEDRVVLQQGRTPVNGPHQGALVDTPGGEWWFVHFQDAGLYGRIVHLNPVEWQDGWPWMGVAAPTGEREPVLSHAKPKLPAAPASAPQTSDDFESKKLGLQWQWHANYEPTWFSLDARPGHLRLFARPILNGDLADTPNLLLQKFPARAFTARTTVELAGQGERAGLVIMGKSHAALAAQRVNGQQLLTLSIDNARAFSVNVPDGALHLGVEVRDGGACQFQYATAAAPEAWTSIPNPFQASAGVWIGAKLGLFATLPPGANAPAYADFAELRFSSPNAR